MICLLHCTFPLTPINDATVMGWLILYIFTFELQTEGTGLKENKWFIEKKIKAPPATVDSD